MAARFLAPGTAMGMLSRCHSLTSPSWYQLPHHSQPALQSRVSYSGGSVDKSKDSHDTVCLLTENDDQIAIACVVELC